MDRIYVSLLIKLIKERPVIWDKKSEMYKNKLQRDKAWREICVTMQDGFDDMEYRDQQEYCKLVQKKWTQVRDSWTKDVKKRRDQKSGSYPHKRYKYSEQLSFLRKLMDKKYQFSDEEGEDMGTEESVSEQIENYRRKLASKKNSTEVTTDANSKRKNEVFIRMDKSETETVQPQKEEDPNLYFFKSLLPTISSLNPDETLQFQGGVINLLQSIKRQRQNSNYQSPGCSTTTFYEQTFSPSSRDSSTHPASPTPVDKQTPATKVEPSEDYFVAEVF